MSVLSCLSLDITPVHLHTCCRITHFVTVLTCVTFRLWVKDFCETTHTTSKSGVGRTCHKYGQVVKCQGQSTRPASKMFVSYWCVGFSALKILYKFRRSFSPMLIDLPPNFPGLQCLYWAPSCCFWRHLYKISKFYVLDINSVATLHRTAAWVV